MDSDYRLCSLPVLRASHVPKFYRMVQQLDKFDPMSTADAIFEAWICNMILFRVMYSMQTELRPMFLPIAMSPADHQHPNMHVSR